MKTIPPQAIVATVSSNAAQDAVTALPARRISAPARVHAWARRKARAQARKRVRRLKLLPLLKIAA